MFCFSIISSFLYCQSYHKLIDENLKWSVLYVDRDYGPDSLYHTLTYDFLGDSIIDSISYKVLYFTLNDNTYHQGARFIREDTNKRVWLKRRADNQEGLLYDFSLVEGDSALIGEKFNGVYMYVDSITNVLVNNTRRSKFWMSCKIIPDYSEWWIEGIGSNRGILQSGSVSATNWDYYTYLLCAHEMEDLIYINNFYNTCLITYVDIPEINKMMINIYPNPAFNEITVDGENINQVSLYDLKGNIISDVPKANNSIKIDVSGLTSGIYIIRIQTNKKVIVKKIIKQ